MTAQHTIDVLNARLHVTRQRGEVFDARCPAHDDSHASLTFGYGDNGGTVIFCHAGCEPQLILAAIGMTMSELSPEPHVVATYDYRDETGELLWQVQRWEPKDFRVLPGLPPLAQRRLYHSEWLPQARATGATVLIAEGERDCDTLAKHGEVAVCNVGGAGVGKWLPQYAQQLAGLDVVVIADADEPGRAHARAVARALDGIAATVSLVEPSYGNDVSEQLDAGYELSTLVPLSVEETLGAHRADHIRERPVAWLWPGYLPMGKLAIVEGDPGDGKSVMTCDLAARLSTGSPLPDKARSPLGPVEVIMISAEDDPEDTITPRLRIAGANLAKIRLVVEGSTPGSLFDLVRDLPALETLVQAHHVKLVVIDPLMAFLPASVDAYRDHEVRRALHPLTKMAARTGAALLVVRHLTKSRGKAITAGGGSIAFTGAARCGYLVGPHPYHEAKRIMTCVKINVGQRPASLGYQVVPDAHDPDLPRVIWDDEPLGLSAQDVLDGHEAVEERDARDDARAFLQELLSANHTGLLWPDIVKAGRREDHTEATLRRIRKQVAKLVRNPIDRNGRIRKGAFWMLPASVGVDANLTDSDVVVGFAHRAHDAALSKQDNYATQSDDDQTWQPDDPDHCDVCGASPAVVFATARAVRCANHNPMTYGGQR